MTTVSVRLPHARIIAVETFRGPDHIASRVTFARPCFCRQREYAARISPSDEGTAGVFNLALRSFDKHRVLSQNRKRFCSERLDIRVIARLRLLLETTD